MKVFRQRAPINRARPSGRARFVQGPSREVEVPPALVPVPGVPVWDPSRLVVAATWAAAALFLVFAVAWHFLCSPR